MPKIKMPEICFPPESDTDSSKQTLLLIDFSVCTGLPGEKSYAEKGNNR